MSNTFFRIVGFFFISMALFGCAPQELPAVPVPQTEEAFEILMDEARMSCKYEGQAYVCSKSLDFQKEEEKEEEEPPPDPSTCEQIRNQPSRYICYSKVAKATGDTSWCYKTDVAAWQINCAYHAVITDCSELEQVNQGWCYATQSQFRDDVRLCELIETDYMQNTCFMNFALSTGNVDHCSSMNDDQEKDACFALTARYHQDEGRCSSLEDVFWRDRCILVVASYAQQQDICDTIEDEEIRNICFINVAGNVGKMDICKKVSEGTERGDHHSRPPYLCVEQVVLSQRHPLGCEEIEEEKERSHCIRELDDLIRNIAICESLEDSFIRNRCWWNMGTFQRYSPFCSKLTPDLNDDYSDQDSCKYEVFVKRWIKDFCSVRKSDGSYREGYHDTCLKFFEDEIIY